MFLSKFNSHHFFLFAKFSVASIRPSGTAAIFLSPSPKKPRLASAVANETKMINIKLENELGTDFFAAFAFC